MTYLLLHPCWISVGHIVWDHLWLFSIDLCVYLSSLFFFIFIDLQYVFVPGKVLFITLFFFFFKYYLTLVSQYSWSVKSLGSKNEQGLHHSSCYVTLGKQSKITKFVFSHLKMELQELNYLKCHNIWHIVNGFVQLSNL